VGQQENGGQLGDFTAGPRMVPLSLLAIVIGIISAYVALALLKLIGFFTNLFFYRRLSTTFASPAANTLGALEVLVPVAGALIVGLMARYGSERIRGHGIPEAIEARSSRSRRIPPSSARPAWPAASSSASWPACCPPC